MEEFIITVVKMVNKFGHVVIAMVGAFAQKFFHSAAENEKIFTKKNFAAVFASGFAAIVGGALLDYYGAPELLKFAVCGVIGWTGGNTIMDMATDKFKNRIDKI